MNRICIAVLLAVMVFASGCGPSEPDATEKLLRAWGTVIESRADYIRVLISEGANVNARDSDGVTPLMQACASESVEIVTLLIEAGADVNPKDIRGMTPLIWAALGSTPEIVSALIEAGADVNAKDRDGWTPLRRATNPEMIKLLKAAGAKE